MEKRATKYIFVTGGVVSSLGKGITVASLGRLLKSRGYKVTTQKLDPYINVDPGTMSPFQHGEVFVTDDGSETDLDLGHYERFVDESLSSRCNVTAGSIYASVIGKERKGVYLGGTVQVIPHITNEIKDRILDLSLQDNPDIAIVEIGGTVGDIEGLPFLEAIRQLRKDLGRNNVLYIHVTLVPYLAVAKELKTKPTQHSVATLRSIGIQPDILICRSDRPMSDNIRKKLALFCDVDTDAVISCPDVEILYEVPLLLHRDGLDDTVFRMLELEPQPSDLEEWQALVRRIKELKNKIKVAIVGKYVDLPDSYISVVESLKHGGYESQAEVEIVWVDAEGLDPDMMERKLRGVDAILIPGGFGVRGIEGKIKAVEFARATNTPFLGICLGMQCAVIEFARNVIGLPDANSSEFDPATPYPVIDLLPEQKEVSDMGGTMRLGAYKCSLGEGTLARDLYKVNDISERHRHRYEVNNAFLPQMESHGLKISGSNPEKELVEIIELTEHPYFIACQFHPEFKSRPNRAHPLFSGLIAAALKTKAKEQEVTVKA